MFIIQRDLEPRRDKWTLPASFIHIAGTIDAAARRQLAQKISIVNVFPKQLYTFGNPRREPRKQVITVASYSLVNLRDHILQTVTDSQDAARLTTSKLPALTFDHKRIRSIAFHQLKGRMPGQPIGFELPPPKFTLSQLQFVNEKVLENPFDKHNFRKISRHESLLNWTRSNRMWRITMQGYISSTKTHTTG